MKKQNTYICICFNSSLPYLPKVLGRPYYSFCLPLDPGRSRLCNLLLGTLATGAVTSLHTSERSMSSKFWVVLANLMSEIQHAMAQCVEQAHDDLSQLLSRTVPSSASARSALSTHSSSSTYQKVNWYKCSLQDPFFQGSSAVSLFGNSVLISPTSLLCLKFSTEHAKTEAQLPQEIKVSHLMFLHMRTYIQHTYVYTYVCIK